MSQLRLAPLLESDVKACARIELELFADESPWSAESFSAELGAGHRYFGARLDEELVGYAGMRFLGRAPDFETEILNVAVRQSAQRRGIGRELLRLLLAEADAVAAPVFLEVRVGNDPAITLYEQHGFTVIGRRKGYYQPHGDDAWTMRRAGGGTS